MPSAELIVWASMGAVSGLNESSPRTGITGHKLTSTRKAKRNWSRGSFRSPVDLIVQTTSVMDGVIGAAR